MRKTLLLILTMAIMTSYTVAQAKNPCEPPLRDGIYSHYRSTTGSMLFSSFKSYLLSEQFRNDLKSRKLGGSVGIPIEGMPVPLKIGANASSQEVTTFQKRITKIKESVLENQFAQTITSSNPNVELAREYFKCVERNRPVGFSVSTEHTSDRVQFLVSFRNIVSSDPMPILQRLNVHNATDYTTSLTVGKPIKDENLISAGRAPEKDLVMEMETNRGSVIATIDQSPRDQSGGSIEIILVAGSPLIQGSDPQGIEVYGVPPLGKGASHSDGSHALIVVPEEVLPRNTVLSGNILVQEVSSEHGSLRDIHTSAEISQSPGHNGRVILFKGFALSDKDIRVRARLVFRYVKGTP